MELKGELDFFLVKLCHLGLGESLVEEADIVDGTGVVVPIIGIKVIVVHPCHPVLGSGVKSGGGEFMLLEFVVEVMIANTVECDEGGKVVDVGKGALPEDDILNMLGQSR